LKEIIQFSVWTDARHSLCAIRPTRD
jgi:hypothetical protein